MGRQCIYIISIIESCWKYPVGMGYKPEGIDFLVAYFPKTQEFQMLNFTIQG